MDSVEPFLFNLFNDPAIISAPLPLRWLLAKWISRRRTPVARERYKKINGKSPLLALTLEQAEALEGRLQDEFRAKVFVAMRYWHPRSKETAAAVAAFDPGEIVLLPLYPQYSTTTGASSIDDWLTAAAAAGLDVPTSTICCYPNQPGLIKAQAKLIVSAIAEAEEMAKPRVLFSAHGLPKKIVARGDPYPWQVELTAKAVVGELNMEDLDWTVCFQSRVGPLEWIGPSLKDELRRAAADGKPVVVVPIAFVSEHSETLVELDMEYRAVALKLGVPAYVRVPAVGIAGDFIGGLAELVGKARGRNTLLCSQGGERLCPSSFKRCPNR